MRVKRKISVRPASCLPHSQSSVQHANFNHFPTDFVWLVGWTLLKRSLIPNTLVETFAAFAVLFKVCSHNYFVQTGYLQYWYRKRGKKTKLVEFQRGAPAGYFWECSIFKGVEVGHIDGFHEMAQIAAFPCVLAGSCSRSEKEQEMKYLALKEMSSLITKFF